MLCYVMLCYVMLCYVMLIISWYRPPNEPFETFDKLEHVLHLIFEAKGKELIILGNTNYDLSTKETGVTNQSKSLFPGHVKRLKDLYQSFGLKQLTTQPTRETENTSTIIDHLAVSNTVLSRLPLAIIIYFTV